MSLPATTTTIGDAADLLNLDVHHVTGPARHGGLRRSAGLTQLIATPCPLCSKEIRDTDHFRVRSIALIPAITSAGVALGWRCRRRNDTAGRARRTGGTDSPTCWHRPTRFPSQRLHGQSGDQQHQRRGNDALQPTTVHYRGSLTGSFDCRDEGFGDFSSRRRRTRPPAPQPVSASTSS